MKRWETIYVVSIGYGEHEYEQRRTQHRTWLGADWQRRFRYRHRGMGSSSTYTCIVRTADSVAWKDCEPAPEPRYARTFDLHVWPAFYWLRSRWDGIRYGLDRDRR